MNKIILTGHLGTDPEMSYFPDGTAVTKFRLAVNSGWGDHERTDWFKVEIIGKKAESVNTYKKKGDQVLVEGRMICDVVDDKYYWKVKATDVEFIGKKQDVEQPAF